MSSSTTLVGGAAVKLALDQQDFKRGLNTAQGEVTKFLKAAAGAFATFRMATRQILPFFERMIKAAADYREELNMFNEVFKEQSPWLREWIKGMMKLSGYSQTFFMRSLAGFGQYLTNSKFAREEAAQWSSLLMEKILDITSLKNIEPAEAIKAMQSVLIAANVRPGFRFGIYATREMAKEEALRMGLAKTKKELTERDRILGSLNIIMKSNKEAIGDMVRTITEVWPAWRRLQGLWVELHRLLGMLLLADIREWLNRVITLVLWMQTWSVQNRQVLRGILKLVGGLTALYALGGGLVLFGLIFGKWMIAIAGVSTAVLVLLDALGLVDTGIRDLTDQVWIGGKKMTWYIEDMVTAVKHAFLNLAEFLLGMDLPERLLAGWLYWFAGMKEAIKQLKQDWRDLSDWIENSFIAKVFIKAWDLYKRREERIMRLIMAHSAYAGAKGKPPDTRLGSEDEEKVLAAHNKFADWRAAGRNAIEDYRKGMDEAGEATSAWRTFEIWYKILTGQNLPPAKGFLEDEEKGWTDLANAIDDATQSLTKFKGGSIAGFGRFQFYASLGVLWEREKDAAKKQLEESEESNDFLKKIEKNTRSAGGGLAAAYGV